jgi:hypothetical protein
MLRPHSDLLPVHSSYEIRVQFLCGVCSDFLSKSVHAAVNCGITVSNYMKTVREQAAVLFSRFYCFLFRDVPEEIRNILKQLFISRDSM